jgi:hypothetical protein
LGKAASSIFTLVTHHLPNPLCWRLRWRREDRNTLGTPSPWVCAGKPKIVATVATMRKMLTILNAIIRDNSPWQTA